MIWHRRGDVSAPANGDAAAAERPWPRRRRCERYNNMRISVARARAHSPDCRISILGAVRDADNKGASIPHCFHSASFFLVPINAGEMISLGENHLSLFRVAVRSLFGGHF